jgi:hypothetical protein
VFATSRIVVLASDDAEAWQEVFSFRVAGRDVRDPHFVVFRDRLFVYSGTWLFRPEGAYTINEHLGYGAWSADGRVWHGPVLLEGTYGHYVWRAAALGDRAFLIGRRVRNFAVGPREDGRASLQAVMFDSADGLVWKTAGMFKESHGDEIAFLFEDDGSMLALARSGGGAVAQVGHAKPPWRDWTWTDLDRNVGGPLLARWGRRYLAGGRKWGGETPPVTMLYWLEGDRLVEATQLPSGGDTSYPGFVALDDTRGIVSYYSSHEGSGGKEAPAAIYLADVSIAP